MTLPGSTNVLFMLAWRNLWRNHRRTIIMLSAISVGVWAMIFMTALTQGMVNDMIKDSISALPGHVQVHHPDYRDDPNINNLLPASDAELSAAFAAADFDEWSTRIKVPAVITSERESRGVTLLGIERVRELAADDNTAIVHALEETTFDGIEVHKREIALAIRVDAEQRYAAGFPFAGYYGGHLDARRPFVEVGSRECS